MQTSQIRSSQRGTVKTLIIALLAVCLPAISQAQGTLTPVPQIVFLDASGNPLNNGKICTYAAGTTTPLATYSDQSLMTANANPIRTNSAGRPTTGGIYLSATSYKFTVLTAGADNTCSTGTTVYTQDNVGAVPATAVALDVTGTAGEALSAGDWAYLSDGSGALTAGRWYKADADNTYSSTTAAMIGVVPTAIASGESGSIRVGGRVTSLSGLTAGELYYVSATAGAITATPPTNAWFVGKAESTTALIVSQNQGGVRFADSDGTHNAVMRITQNLTADRVWAVTWGDAAITTNFTPGSAGMFLRSDGTNWAASTLVLPNAATANQVCYASATDTVACGNAAFTFNGTDVTTTGDFSFGGGDLIATANSRIRRSTSDGADNGSVTLAGGGAVGNTRGSDVIVNGNESSNPGYVEVDLGNVAGSLFVIRNAAGGNAFIVNADDNELFAQGVYDLTDAGAANVVLVGTAGNLRRSTSSLRYKQDFAPITLREAKRVVAGLAAPFTTQTYAGPITYRGINPWDSRRRWPGFGAEYVATISPDLVTFDQNPDGSNGQPNAVLYDRMAAYLTPVVADQEQRLDKQLDLIAGIEARLRALEAENAELRARLGLSPR